MRRITTLILGMILGGGLVYGAYQYHLVRTGEQFLLIPKGRVSLVDPYVDVRDWGLSKWQEHPELLEAMRSQGHGDLVPTGEQGKPRSPSAFRLPESAFGDHESSLSNRRSQVPRSGRKDEATRKQ